AGGPFRSHADAQQGAEDQQEGESRREAGDEITDRVPQDGDHQRRLAPQAIAHPAGSRGADQPHPQGKGEHDRDSRDRYPELLRDRQHDEQEDGEVERVERPTKPGGDIGVPLILGRFLPPWHSGIGRNGRGHLLNLPFYYRYRFTLRDSDYSY